MLRVAVGLPVGVNNRNELVGEDEDEGISDGLNVGDKDEEDGIAVGEDEDEGIADGVDVGRNVGFTVGRAVGVAVGRTEGFDVGRRVG